MSDLNMDAERADFEEWGELTASQKEGTAHDIAGWYYFDELTEDRWQVWKARASRTAPVSSPIGEELPAPAGMIDFMDEFGRLSHKHGYTVEQVQSIVAPYAARIRQLERELAGRSGINPIKRAVEILGTFPGELLSRERKTVSVDTQEALAWAAFAENGNVIIWSRRHDEVEPVAAKYGRPVVPVIAYIDGRTAGAAPAGWKLVPVEPTKDMLDAARLQWALTPGNAIEESYAAMMRAAPTPMNSGKEEGK
jgi:hypothetical protein